MRNLKALLLIFLCSASLSAETSLIKVGVIGDSISHPHPVHPYQAYYYLLERDFDKEGLPFRVVNYSAGGSTTDTAKKRLKEMLKEDKPHILIIALGINDMWQQFSVSHIENNLKDTLELAYENHLPVLLGLLELDAAPGLPSPDYALAFQEMTGRLQEDYPELKVFPFLTTEMMTDPSYATFDVVHVNDKGHELVAEEIKPLLRPLLRRMVKVNTLPTAPPRAFIEAPPRRAALIQLPKLR